MRVHVTFELGRDVVVRDDARFDAEGVDHALRTHAMAVSSADGVDDDHRRRARSSAMITYCCIAGISLMSITPYAEETFAPGMRNWTVPLLSSTAHPEA